MEAGNLAQRLRANARTADELHARSRALLVEAARDGARAGLSQREIAEAIGRSQPEVSRLLRFHGATPLGRRLSSNRARVLRIAREFGARNVRVFGSVARGSDRADSDVDLLVDASSDLSLFELARLEEALSEILGAPVDVVPAGALRPHLATRALSEAIAL